MIFVFFKFSHKIVFVKKMATNEPTNEQKNQVTEIIKE